MKGMKAILYSIGGLFVIPALGLLAPVLLVSGLACPVIGLIRLIADWFNLFDATFIQFLMLDNSLMIFASSFFMGAILFIAGLILLRGLFNYLRNQKKAYLTLLSR